MLSTIASPLRRAAARSATGAARRAAPPLRPSAPRGARATTTSASADAAADPAMALRKDVRGLEGLLGVGGGLALAGLHSATGSADDFYNYRFYTKKDPDDVASFYGGEELMDLFCVVPIVSKIMMRLATFDDTGNVITQGIPGTMKVSMVFSDETNEETGRTDWFNKRERFKDTLFGYTCYDMVINFGFRTLEDGRIQCYHVGEYFHGNLPIVSQLMLLIFKIQARWVAWATEHHVNHYAFDNDDEEGEKMEHDSRVNMPLFLLKNYAWLDLTSMLFGPREGDGSSRSPSFLVTRNQKRKSASVAEDEEEDEDDDEEEDEDEMEDELPFQTKAAQIQIAEDIESDKRAMKALLKHHTKAGTADVKTILTKRATLAKRHTTLERRRTAIIKSGGAAPEEIDDNGLMLAEEEEQDRLAKKDAYSMATDLAVNRAQMRRMTRRVTRQNTLRRAAAAQAKAEEKTATVDIEPVTLHTQVALRHTAAFDAKAEEKASMDATAEPAAAAVQTQVEEKTAATAADEPVVVTLQTKVEEKSATDAPVEPGPVVATSQRKVEEKTTTDAAVEPAVALSQANAEEKTAMDAVAA